MSFMQESLCIRRSASDIQNGMFLSSLCRCAHEHVIVDAPGNGLDIGAVVDSKTKLKFDNIAYACRIFSGTHGEEQREAIQKALKKEYCMFVSEWGLCSIDMKGGIYYLESDKWLEFLSEYRVSWCIYAIGSKVNNDSNALNLLSDKYTDEVLFLVLSLFLSTMLWMYIQIITNPVVSKNMTVPISKYQDSDLPDNMWVQYPVNTVDITIVGRANTINQLTPDDIIVSVDYSNINDEDTGIVNLKVNVKPRDNGVYFRVDRQQPQTIPVTVYSSNK